MKVNKLLLYFFCVLMSLNIYGQDAADQKHQNYLFFLHNRFTEEMPFGSSHPEYGKSEYLEIIDAFKNAGFQVLSEKRPAGTDVTLYAKKVVYQIDSLIKMGINADHITVVGTSKGGYIAQMTSTLLANPNVNFVFIGSYRDQDLVKMPQINFCGNILTIFERSDEFGVSAIKRKERSNLKVTRFKEIELNTGLKHGFLFKPLNEWIGPVVMWGKRKYNLI